VYGFKYSEIKLPSIIYFSNHLLSILSLINFSIIKLDIGAAHLEPQYPFSINTQIAIFGSSAGANPINIE